MWFPGSGFMSYRQSGVKKDAFGYQILWSELKAG